VPFVEAGVALSVIVLGAIVAFGVEAPLAAPFSFGRRRRLQMPTSLQTIFSVRSNLGFTESVLLHCVRSAGPAPWQLDSEKELLGRGIGRVRATLEIGVQWRAPQAKLPIRISPPKVGGC
jgi:hypothetical protein